MVIVEWATHENALAASDGFTEVEHPHYLGNWDLPGFRDDLSEALFPVLSPPNLALAHGVVGWDPGAYGTTAAWNRVAIGKSARLREVAQVPSPATGVNIGDPLREHLGDGWQAALTVRIERSRDLEVEVVGTSLAGPALDEIVEDIIEPVP